jgi:hypothetical protein
MNKKVKIFFLNKGSHLTLFSILFLSLFNFFANNLRKFFIGKSRTNSMLKLFLRSIKLEIKKLNKSLSPINAI